MSDVFKLGGWQTARTWHYLPHGHNIHDKFDHKAAFPNGCVRLGLDVCLAPVPYAPEVFVSWIRGQRKGVHRV